MANESPNLGFVSFLPWTSVSHGEIREGTAAAQLPSVPCKVVLFKTPATNAGTVYVGASTVTVEGTVTNTTAGYPLAASATLGPLYVDNLNRFYALSDGTADNLNYLALA